MHRIHTNLALGVARVSLTCRKDTRIRPIRSPKADFENNLKENKLPKVRLDTIDSYLQKECILSIDLLKIDVEGYELEVLKGRKMHLKKGWFRQF